MQFQTGIFLFLPPVSGTYIHRSHISYVASRVIDVYMFICFQNQNPGLLNHRFIDLFWFKETFKTIKSNPALLRDHIYMCLKPHQGWRLHTAVLGSLFQGLTTILGKKLFLILNPNLPWCKMRLFPLVLSLLTWRSDQPLHRISVSVRTVRI